MLEKAASFFLKAEPVRWIAGPIFQKELLVASRRRRTYALRAGYVAALAFFFLLVLAEFGPISASGPAAGIIIGTVFAKFLVSSVCFFLWAAGTIVATALLSGAMNEELKLRTLPVLFTTPISIFQIVLGKLLSRLFQLLLLMALTLPVLALVRVYGGVPWYSLLNAAVLSLTSALFAASISMLLSVFNRKGRIVFLETLLFLLALNLLGLWAANSWWRSGGGGPGGTGWLGVPLLVRLPSLFVAYSSSLLAARELLGSFYRGYAGAMLGPYAGPIHYLVVFAESLFLIGLTTFFLRRTALGRTREAEKSRRRRKKGIRFIKNCPVFHKEMISSFALGGITSRAAYAVLVLLLAGSYIVWRKDLRSPDTQATYSCFLLFLSLFGTLSTAAGTITSEKESGTWDLILMTPLSGDRIVFGKFRAALCKTWPVWFLFLGHILLFVAMGVLHPILVLFITMPVLAAAPFVAAVGVLASARCRSTTRALVAAILALLLFWGVIPIMLSAVTPGGIAIIFHPVHQVWSWANIAAGDIFFHHPVISPTKNQMNWFVLGFFVIAPVLFHLLAAYTLLRMAAETLRPYRFAGVSPAPPRTLRENPDALRKETPAGGEAA